MKKTILATLLTLSSTAFSADHAILNVEGEIQINGKTVIDENGQLISTADTIDITPYRNDQGLKKTYHYASGDAYSVWDFTTPNVERYTDYDEFNNLLWQSKLTYHSSTQFTEEMTSQYSTSTSDCQMDLYNDDMDVPKPMGNTFSKSYIQRCEHSEKGNLVETKYDVRTPLTKLSFVYKDSSAGEVILDDCILTKRERTSGSHQEVLCRDVGMVYRKYSNGNELNIVGIENKRNN
ncbi:hypothetical protein BCU83_13770 [Vibrio breoganii]|uniref:hypothetical protein n=1 Tax=Vibrio breoganii TaxID=553239 RepID=UPI000C825952|nr:hypothetical protein [Vibrio breoganii]PMG79280.1 hypothetical protein BCU83_13770 [Vibrio breoganii]